MTPTTFINSQTNNIKTITSLIDILSNIGYLIKSKSTNNWTATNKKNGITIELYFSDAQPQNVKTQLKLKRIKIRNNIGNYLMWGTGYFTHTQDNNYELTLLPQTGPRQKLSGINNITEHLKTLIGQKPDKKWTNINNLPNPLEFTEPYTTIPTDNPKNPTFTNKTFYLSCKCEKLGTINKNLKITDNYQQPGDKIWLIINGIAINNKGERTNAAIIVNEEINGYYPLTQMKTGQYRITDNLTPNNGKTDFTRISKNDQELIRIAITHYLTNLTKQ